VHRDKHKITSHRNIIQWPITTPPLRRPIIMGVGQLSARAHNKRMHIAFVANKQVSKFKFMQI